MTRPASPPTRLRRTPRTTPRLSPELIATLTGHLTTRDRELLATVWEHRVLTTTQLAAIYYPSVNRAQQRLARLHRLGALLRFRPWTPVGSMPAHWVLGPAGAHVLATEQDTTTRAFGYSTERALMLATSTKLAHQIGVNGFFADLYAHARHRADGRAVTEWWSERHCLNLWKGLARPDAFGRWIEPRPDGTHAEIDFFLEHDTGSNPLPRLVAKLEGYELLAESTGIITPALFWLPSARRETGLRALLPVSPIPIATAVHTPTGLTPPGEGPAGPIWLLAGQPGPRHRLAALASAWRQRPPETD